MHGLHLTADLHGCDPRHGALVDARVLREACRRAVAQAGLLPVGELFHRFDARSPGEPQGVTGVVLLAESHVAVHTWPERGAVTLDVYVCNVGADNSARAQHLLDTLVAAFAPAHVHRQRLQRGPLPGLVPPRTPALPQP